VTFTATLTPVQASSEPVTGTVQFFVDEVPFGSGSISNDVATFVTSSLPAGADTITSSYSGDSNYAASTSSPITETVIAQATFGVSSSPSEVIVSRPGSSGSTMLTFTAMNGYSGTISFSPTECAGLPTESNCNFSAPSVTLSSSMKTATVTLTVSTTASSSFPSYPVRSPHGLKPPALSKLAGAVLSVIAFATLLGLMARTRAWTMFRNLAIGILLIALTAALGSCGGGGSTATNSGTPPGNYQVVITFNQAGVSPSPSLGFILTVQ
jgi:trimeric autotransporter adhesin